MSIDDPADLTALVADLLLLIDEFGSDDLRARLSAYLGGDA